MISVVIDEKIKEWLEQLNCVWFIPPVGDRIYFKNQMWCDSDDWGLFIGDSGRYVHSNKFTEWLKENYPEAFI